MDGVLQVASRVPTQLGQPALGRLRRSPAPRRVAQLAASVVLLVSGGCAATQAVGDFLFTSPDRMRERELEHVAKDWCQTIRASQVIPVYPLTEDVLPGDVFLVTTPVPEQAKAYRERGFLPLDMHKARLMPIDFAAFYQDSRGSTKTAKLPYPWIFPPDGLPGASEPVPGAMVAVAAHGGTNGGTNGTNGGTNGDEELRKHLSPTAFWKAPAASFPSYSFTVSTSTGISAAIPVQSVPVALGLMNTTEATGSVQLSDAYVYGISEDRLRTLLDVWVDEHLPELDRLRLANPDGVMLRVVNRVYLIGGVNVSLTNATSGNIKTNVGADTSASMPGTTPAGEEPTGAIDLSALSELATAGTPGGSVDYSFATDRNVVANETFRRPLVVGYIALDYPILKGGRLGEAIATARTLNGEETPEPDPSAVAGDATEQETALYKAAIGSMGHESIPVYEAAAKLMPVQFRQLLEAKLKQPDTEMTVVEAFGSAEGEYTMGSATRRSEILLALKTAWRDANHG